MKSSPSESVGGGRKSPTKPFPKGTKFVCPKCDTWVQVHIPVEFRPECTKHSGGTTKMVEVPL
jgi:hypothetical protein